MPLQIIKKGVAKQVMEGDVISFYTRQAERVGPAIVTSYREDNDEYCTIFLDDNTARTIDLLHEVDIIRERPVDIGEDDVVEMFAAIHTKDLELRQLVESVQVYLENL